MAEATERIIITTILDHYPGVQAIYFFGPYGTESKWADSDIDMALLLSPLQAKQGKNLPISQCRY